MKIEGPNRTQGTSSAKGKSKVSGGDANFEDFFSNGASAPAEAGASRQIASVDALLAVQETEDPTERAARRRMHDRSEKILDSLDRIRMGMLAGDLTVGDMIDIADVVASHREKIQDPALVEIMDEVDLRAQVEIAKMKASMSSVASGDDSFV